MNSRVFSALERLQEEKSKHPEADLAWLKWYHEDLQTLIMDKGISMTAQLLGCSTTGLKTYLKRNGLRTVIRRAPAGYRKRHYIKEVRRLVT